MLRELVADGTTLLLTTQYLEEADQLADNIVVIDRGTVIAEGTPLAAQGPVRRRRPRGHRLPRATTSRPPRRCCDDHVREVHVDAGARQLTAPAEGLGT